MNQDNNLSEAAKEVVLDLNEGETSVDKCTKQLNNDMATGIEEVYNYFEVFSDEFEDDYKADVPSTNPLSSDPDNAFGDGGNRCDDIEE